MPAAASPGKVLHGGEFYSPIAGKLHTDGVVLSELVQAVSRKIPRHEHELAYVTVVLQGHYREGDRGKLVELQPFTAVFNPSGVIHSTMIGQAGAAFFTIELRGQRLRELGILLPQDILFDRGAGTMLWPGLRLYSAFKSATADSLLLESHVLEMLGAIAKVELRDDVAPPWLGRVKERLHEDFRDNLRMSELANEAGVHPVHLARVFRKHEKQTPGEYLQRLRVHAVCKMLQEPEWALASIGAECGFSDQSHLTRVFKKLTGATPANFRDACLRKKPRLRFHPKPCLVAPAGLVHG